MRFQKIFTEKVILERKDHLHLDPPVKNLKMFSTLFQHGGLKSINDSVTEKFTKKVQWLRVRFLDRLDYRL